MDVVVMESQSFLRALDRLFWVAWAAFPVVFWFAYQGSIDRSAISAQFAGLSDECLKALPVLKDFSSTGKSAIAVYFAQQFGFYGLLLWLAHATLHRCATGTVYVDDTLRTLGLLGLTITAFPFVDLLASNVLGYALVRSGDLKEYSPNFLFDVGPFAVGLLLLAMRIVIAHAIAMKRESDLTI
jgi:Protein of unknown function (DUF2975)